MSARLTKLEGKVRVLMWMAAVNMVVTVAVLFSI